MEPYPLPPTDLPMVNEYFTINDPRDRIGSFAYIGFISPYLGFCVIDIMSTHMGVMDTIHLHSITQYSDLESEVEKFRNGEPNLFTQHIDALNARLDADS